MQKFLRTFALLVAFVLTPSWAETTTSFTLTVPNGYKEGIREVRLRNGVKLTLIEHDYRHELRVTLKGRAFDTGLGGTTASILAAYPSKADAAVVFAWVWSGGSAFPPELVVLHPDEGFYKHYSVGLPAAVKGVVEGSAPPKVTAVKVRVEEDAVGDPVYADLKLVPGIGFVNPQRFRGKYASLGGKFADDYLSDPALREPVLTAMGAERFKELRTYMHRSGEVIALEGRWLILRGCHKDGCAGTGVIVLDAEEDVTFWAAYDAWEQVQFSGTTRKLVPEKYRTYFNALANEKLSGAGFTVEIRPGGIPYFHEKVR